MPQPIGLWLWDDGKNIQWWSMYGKGRANRSHAPHNTSGSLADILQDSAEDAFIRSLEELANYPSSIYLMDSLPEAWINFRWEDRRLRRGQRIGDLAPVVRQVPLTAPNPVPINRDDVPMLMLRFYSNDDFKHEKWKGKNLQRAQNVQDLYKKLNNYPDAPLLIFAHGNNGDENESKPLKDKQGNPWAWPESITPPAVIIILACDHAGHQRSFARYLLQEGAKSVVIATDLLDARKAWCMAEALSRERIKEYFSLAAWVAKQENLELWGVDAIGDAIGTTGHRNQYESITPWVALQGAVLQTQNLAPSITKSTELWRNAYDLDKEDELHALAWLSRMQQLLPQWRKQGWDEVIRGVLPLALELSERHRHELMTFFRSFCTQEESVEIHDSLAKCYYRKGDYCRSLRHIAQALDGEGKSMVSLLTLLNILIDLNLPTLGSALLSIIRLRLDNLPEKDIHGRQFKLLDQRARLSIRSGEMKHAIRLMKQKQKEQSNHCNQIYRESAWLLFLYAWMNPNSVEARTLAQSAQNYLKCDDIHLGEGNADHKYIARALACWAWRADQIDVEDIIKKFWQRTCHEEYGYDPGPLGQSIAYIAMLEKNHSKKGWASEAWPHARIAMHDEGYWFETTILDALLGENEQSRETYQKFRSLKNRAMNLLSEQVFSSIWSSVDMTAMTQHDTEMETMLEKHDVHVATDQSEMIKALTRCGWLPI